MNREDIRNEVRATLPVELTALSDTYLNNLINRGVRYIGRRYPFPVSIVDLDSDADEPAFAEEFHWLVVEWVAATIFMNAGDMETGGALMQLFDVGVRDMIKFYTGGRT